MSDQEPIVVGGAPKKSNRRVMIIAAVGALLFAVFVLPGLLGGGGGDEDDFEFPAPPPTAPGDVPASGDGVEPPLTSARFSSKNPFTPLVATAPVGDSGAAPPDTVPDPAFPPIDDFTFGDGFGDDFGEGDFGSDDGTSGTDGPEDGTTSTTAPTAPPARQPDRIGMLRVFRDADGRLLASVRVNDTVFQVATGNDFAGSYRVVSLDETRRCGQLLFGDERFSLCEGEETFR